MVCNSCRQVNFPGDLVCTKCKADLTARDVLPVWMRPEYDPAAPDSLAQAAPPGPVVSLSVEDLLRVTQVSLAPAPAPAARPGEPAPPPVMPGPGPGRAAVPPPEAAPAELSLEALVSHSALAGTVAPRPVAAPAVATEHALPLPDFHEPPLWSRPTTIRKNAWREEPSAVPLANPAFMPQAGRARPEAGPADSAEYGLERGHYFYTDELGEIVALPLAGYISRVVGAVIDAILSGIFARILLIAILPLVRLDISSPNFENLLNLISISVALVASFLYHTIQVGLGGQTLGHRIMGLKVIRRKGRSVGVLGAVIRNLYGLVPLLLPTLLLGSARTVPDVQRVLIIAGVIYLVLLVGLLWPLWDKGRQGWHDKLADTYVVSARKPV